MAAVAAGSKSDDELLALVAGLVGQERHGGRGNNPVAPSIPVTARAAGSGGGGAGVVGGSNGGGGGGGGGNGGGGLAPHPLQAAGANGSAAAASLERSRSYDNHPATGNHTNHNHHSHHHNNASHHNGANNANHNNHNHNYDNNHNSSNNQPIHAGGVGQVPSGPPNTNAYGGAPGSDPNGVVGRANGGGAYANGAGWDSGSFDHHGAGRRRSGGKDGGGAAADDSYSYYSRGENIDRRRHRRDRRKRKHNRKVRFEKLGVPWRYHVMSCCGLSCLVLFVCHFVAWLIVLSARQLRSQCSTEGSERRNTAGAGVGAGAAVAVTQTTGSEREGVMTPRPGAALRCTVTMAAPNRTVVGTVAMATEVRQVAVHTARAKPAATAEA